MRARAAIPNGGVLAPRSSTNPCETSALEDSLPDVAFALIGRKLCR